MDKEMILELKEIKQENLEALFNVFCYASKNFIKSFFKNGLNSSITFKNKEIVRDFIKIIREEN